MEFLFSQEAILYVYIPILIFLARVLDVSLGTVRIILISKGIKIPATIIGFFEVFVWISAIAVILNNLNNVFGYLAYALGFSFGTYAGMVIEEKLSLGKVRLTVMTKKNITAFLDNLKPTNYVYVSKFVQSSDGKIRIISAFLERKHLQAVLKKIKNQDPDSFFIVEDLKMIKEVENGGIPQKRLFIERFALFKRK
ncbi:MAG: DUF2179 domain-containing protein [Candidatus Woesearchaeota archaeon]